MDSEFGDIVKVERIARGWTIRDMCDKLGRFGSGTYTPPYICYIESSKKLPSVSLVLKYTQLMGFPEGYLWEIAKKELIENYKKRLDKSWARKLKT
jgi:transcriptional regulator with XRE-family HTH domain